MSVRTKRLRTFRTIPVDTRVSLYFDGVRVVGYVAQGPRGKVLTYADGTLVKTRPNFIEYVSP